MMKTSQPFAKARPGRHLRVTIIGKRREAEARRKFFKSIAEAQPSPASENVAMELVRFTRAAKDATFLDQYKIAA
jgi:hypothetical protein